MTHNDWDHLDNAPLGIAPPGMPDAPRFPDAALRYGSYRDRQPGDIEWEYGWGWLVIGTASIGVMWWDSPRC